MKTNKTSKLQIIAILLLFAGWGWSAGNFTPGDAPFINPLFHCIPLVVLMVLALPLLRLRVASQNPEPQGTHSTWNVVGLSAFAVVGILGATIMVILGAANPDPNAVGVKTLEDWFPTIIMYAGNILWLSTLFFLPRNYTAR